MATNINDLITDLPRYTYDSLGKPKEVYIDDFFDPLLNTDAINYLTDKYGNRLMGTLGGYYEGVKNAWTGKKGILGPGMGVLSYFGRTMDKVADPMLGILSGDSPSETFQNIFMEDQDYTGKQALANVIGTVGNVDMQPEDLTGFGWNMAGLGVELATDPGILGSTVARLTKGTPELATLNRIGQGLSDIDDFFSKIAINGVAPGSTFAFKKGLNFLRQFTGSSEAEDIINSKLKSQDTLVPHTEPFTPDPNTFANFSDGTLMQTNIGNGVNPADANFITDKMIEEYTKHLTPIQIITDPDVAEAVDMIRQTGKEIKTDKIVIKPKAKTKPKFIEKEVSVIPEGMKKRLKPWTLGPDKPFEIPKSFSTESTDFNFKGEPTAHKLFKSEEKIYTNYALTENSFENAYKTKDEIEELVQDHMAELEEVQRTAKKELDNLEVKLVDLEYKRDNLLANLKTLTGEERKNTLNEIKQLGSEIAEGRTKMDKYHELSKPIPKNEAKKYRDSLALGNYNNLTLITNPIKDTVSTPYLRAKRVENTIKRIKSSQLAEDKNIMQRLDKEIFSKFGNVKMGDIIADRSYNFEQILKSTDTELLETFDTELSKSLSSNGLAHEIGKYSMDDLANIIVHGETSGFNIDAPLINAVEKAASTSLEKLGKDFIPLSSKFTQAKYSVQTSNIWNTVHYTPMADLIQETFDSFRKTNNLENIQDLGNLVINELDPSGKLKALYSKYYKYKKISTYQQSIKSKQFGYPPKYSIEQVQNAKNVLKNINKKAPYLAQLDKFFRFASDSGEGLDFTYQKFFSESKRIGTKSLVNYTQEFIDIFHPSSKLGQAASLSPKLYPLVELADDLSQVFAETSNLAERLPQMLNNMLRANTDTILTTTLENGRIIESRFDDALVNLLRRHPTFEIKEFNPVSKELVGRLDIASVAGVHWLQSAVKHGNTDAAIDVVNKYWKNPTKKIQVPVEAAVESGIDTIIKEAPVEELTETVKKLEQSTTEASQVELANKVAEMLDIPLNINTIPSHSNNYTFIEEFPELYKSYNSTKFKPGSRERRLFDLVDSMMRGHLGIQNKERFSTLDNPNISHKLKSLERKIVSMPQIEQEKLLRYLDASQNYTKIRANYFDDFLASGGYKAGIANNAAEEKALTDFLEGFTKKVNELAKKDMTKGQVRPDLVTVFKHSLASKQYGNRKIIGIKINTNLFTNTKKGKRYYAQDLLNDVYRQIKGKEDEIFKDLPETFTYYKPSEAVKKVEVDQEALDLYNELTNELRQHYAKLGYSADAIGNTYFHHTYLNYEQANKQLGWLLGNHVDKFNPGIAKEITKAVRIHNNDTKVFHSMLSTRALEAPTYVWNSFDDKIKLFNDTSITQAVRSSFTSGIMANKSYQSFVDLVLNPNYTIKSNFDNVEHLQKVLDEGGNMSAFSVVTPVYDEKTGRLLKLQRHNKLSKSALEKVFQDDSAVLLPNALFTSFDRILKKDAMMQSKIFRALNKNFIIPFKFGLLTNPGFILGNMTDAVTKSVLTDSVKYNKNTVKAFADYASSMAQTVHLNNNFEELYSKFIDEVGMAYPMDALFSSTRLRSIFDNWLKGVEIMPGVANAYVPSSTEQAIAHTYFKISPLQDLASPFSKSQTMDIKFKNPTLKELSLPSNMQKQGIKVHDKNPIRNLMYGTDSHWGLFLNNPVNDAVLRASSSIENLVRSAHFFSELKHAELLTELKLDNNRSVFVLNEALGDTVKNVREYTSAKTLDALDKMNATHFSYEDITQFMQGASYVIPFPTFFVKNMVYWLDMLDKHPQVLEAIVDSQKALWEDKKEDVAKDEFTAQTMGRGAIPLLGNYFKPTGTQSMFTAFNTMNSPLDSIYYRLNPLTRPFTRHLRPDEDVKYRPYSTNMYERNIKQGDDKFNDLSYTLHSVNPYERTLNTYLRTPNKIKQGTAQLSDFLPSVFQPDFTTKKGR